MVATLTATSITIGSPSPRRLAQFYAELLGWPLTGAEGPGLGEPDDAGWAQLKPPPGESGTTINIEWERHFQRPVWPAEAGRPLASQHLDIRVTGDLDEAETWALGRGAVLAAVQPQEGVRVLFDPDGHPFCLFA